MRGRTCGGAYKKQLTTGEGEARSSHRVDQTFTPLLPTMAAAAHITTMVCVCNSGPARRPGTEHGRNVRAHRSGISRPRRLRALPFTQATTTASPQGTRWVFTLNIAALADAESATTELATWGTWLRAQLEVAPTTGQLHFQGCVGFPKNMRIAALKKLGPHAARAHWEVAKGTIIQMVDYVGKTETRWVSDEQPLGISVAHGAGVVWKGGW